MHSRLVQTGRYLRTLARAFLWSLRGVLLASEAKHVRDHFIDVMSIDIEGHEIPTLRSNNWARWTPAIILGEDHLPFGRSFEDNALALFLCDRSYAVVSRVHFTTFFVHRDHAERLAW